MAGTLVCQGSEPFAPLRNEDSDDESKRKVLKASVDVVPLPIPDIHDKWQKVASDAFMAMWCTIPGASVLATGYMVRHYLIRRWRLIFPKEQTLGKRFRSVMLWEALAWIILISITVEDAIFVLMNDASLTYQNYHSNSKDLAEEARADFAFAPIYIVNNICLLGAFLLLRVLVIQSVEVAADVHIHKVAARQEPKLNNFKHHGMGKRAYELLQRLQDAFPDCYQREDPPVTIHDVTRNWETTETDLRAMTWSSSILLFVLLTWQQLSVFYGTKVLWEWPQAPEWTNKQRIFLLAVFLRTCFAATSWFHLIRGILCTTACMKGNAYQLLVFTTLTNYSKVDTWSKKDRSSLKSILYSNHNALGGLPSDEDLQRCLDEALGTDRLDLMCLEDIKAWWDLRRYIQIDFMDESAMMDYCGVLTIILLICFGLAGVMDWIAHADPCSPGLLLILVFAACLSMIMLDVIQVCIDINQILERDSLVLVDAAADAILSKRPDAVEVATLLRAVERKVDMFDDRQQVLGVPMTANYRNGWILSILFAALSALWEMIKTARTDLLDFVESQDDVWWNVTTWLGHFFCMDEPLQNQTNHTL
ncbi:unnamed protein product [Symbiodinium sp. KB8]|nr:unnamed protein product [Symbiodinium sp. KB8]